MLLAVESKHMATLTDNEVNNLIFLFLKFGLQKLIPDTKKPSNKLIKEIMLAVSDNPTKENITKEVLALSQKRYGITLTDLNIRGLEKYMDVLYDNFMNLSEHMRNDLGTDREDDIFNTKH